MIRKLLTGLLISCGLIAGGSVFAEPETLPAAAETATAPAMSTPAAEPAAAPAGAGEPAAAEAAPEAPAAEAAPAADAVPAPESAPAVESAAAVEPAAAPVEVAKAKRDDGMVCRMEAPIGSNRMKRVCKPRAQVDEEARRTQDRQHGSTIGR